MIKFCKDILYKAFVNFNCLRATRNWQSSNIKSNTPTVFYGLDKLPQKSELASGGIIKCQDLNQRFPNTRNGFNILYLVSSSLPRCVNNLIRFSKRNNIKIVWNQNGVAYLGWHGPGWEKSNEMLANYIHASDYVIYQSNFCKLSAEKYLGRFKGPSTVLYNPVDTQIFVPGFRSENINKILIAGTHNQSYRIFEAIKVVKNLVVGHPDLQLTIAGPLRWTRVQAEAKNQVFKLIAELDLTENIQLVGAYSQNEAVHLFQSHHILLHTQYNDACPRLTVEAMACGMPVVYSASGGTPELVGSDAGVGISVPLSWECIHYAPTNIMAEAIMEIIYAYNKYSHNARVRAESFFGVDKWVSQHSRIFNEIL